MPISISAQEIKQLCLLLQEATSISPKQRQTFAEGNIPVTVPQKHLSPLHLLYGLSRHFPCFLEKPLPHWQADHLRMHWIAFFTGEGWCIYSPPCPHSYIPHAISTRATNTVDKCPIQSLGSLQTFEHFLASSSWSLQITNFSPINWAKIIVSFCCTEPIRLFKALWLQKLRKKSTSSRCSVVYKYLLKSKSAASLAREHCRTGFHRRNEAQWTQLLLLEYLWLSLSFII